jgi:hypothetical protein
MGMKDVRDRAKRERQYYASNDLQRCVVCGRLFCRRQTTGGPGFDPRGAFLIALESRFLGLTTTLNLSSASFSLGPIQRKRTRKSECRLNEQL